MQTADELSVPNRKRLYVNNANPGWYPDSTDSSRLRYWDGQTWTEHTAPAGQLPTAPSGAGGPGAASGVPAQRQQNWFMRHKVLTAILAIVLILLVAGVAGGGGGSDDDGDNIATDDTSASTEPTEEADPTEETQPTEDAQPTKEAEPTEEAEPQTPEGSLPQEDGDWRLDSVQLKDDGLGDFGGIARITYIGEDSNASNIFTITVLDKSGGVVATLNGSAEGMNPDGTETVQLISSDPWKSGKYTLFDFQKGL